ncbi:hypothetical protein L579_1455 [Pantoea sp. AS-PWVM4]|nr:hypothetical protein L579_1455 [Pantoea sp. AS-PWVM4]
MKIRVCGGSWGGVLHVFASRWHTHQHPRCLVGERHPAG